MKIPSKIFKSLISIGLITLPATILYPSAGYAELNCSALDGKWTGKMRGLQNGPTSFKIKNCKLAWKLPDGRTNNCKYREKDGVVKYSCSLGSRGIVKIQGSKIQMKNVYTANQHGAYTANFTK